VSRRYRSRLFLTTKGTKLTKVPSPIFVSFVPFVVK